NLLPSCQEIRIVAAAVVETHPQPRPLAASTATYPLAEEQIALPARSLLCLGGPGRFTPRPNPPIQSAQPAPGTPLLEVVNRIAGYICDNFTYAKDVTLASSPIDDVLREGKGVCQDFTHLMIALVRSFGIPARYVSGYIHRPNNESQSHA